MGFVPVLRPRKKRKFMRVAGMGMRAEERVGIMEKVGGGRLEGGF